MTLGHIFLIEKINPLKSSLFEIRIQIWPFRIRENFQYALEVEGDQTVIACAGGDLKFSAAASASLTSAFSGAPFKGELFAGLANNEGQEILQKLIAFGAVELILDD